MKVFAGSSNPALAAEVVKYLKIDAGRMVRERFSDGEIRVYIDENVRGEDVFIVQTGSRDANYHMMELFLMIDAFKRASADRITAVIPYYAYARQDWKDRPRVPVSARLMADLLETAGADRVLTMDLHSPQIQGFFGIPVDNLTSVPVIANHVEHLRLPNLTVVSPDAGGVGRARAFAKRLEKAKVEAPLAIIDKRRPKPNAVKVLHVIGDVRDQACLMFDDMVDTAGTLVMGAEALLQAGAREVYAACTHPVLSGKAVANIQGSPLRKLYVTNTIPLSAEAAALPTIEVISVAELLGEAIRRIHEGSSVSSLFE